MDMHTAARDCDAAARGGDAAATSKHRLQKEALMRDQQMLIWGGHVHRRMLLKEHQQRLVSDHALRKLRTLHSCTTTVLIIYMTSS